MSGLAGAVPADRLMLGNSVGYYVDTDVGGDKTFSVGAVENTVTGLALIGAAPTWWMGYFANATVPAADALSRLRNSQMTPSWLQSKGVENGKDPRNIKGIFLPTQAELGGLNAVLETENDAPDGTPGWQVLLTRLGLVRVQAWDTQTWADAASMEDQATVEADLSARSDEHILDLDNAELPEPLAGYITAERTARGI